ncbi:unnamed protein product [Dracunculus medinensis]|uniref:WD_REPEATS_REGION domain-containing protein n=1 Tax=Dracunculus medinensis TaxID=318479 RepID=A0A158Q4J0_DRAME|nr:unnamed protein product [Dracunculus medinensis]
MSGHKAINSTKLSFKYLSTVFECHRKTIYGVSFNPYVTENPHFATVAENRVSVYCVPKGSPSIKLLRSFQDPVKEEAFFTVSWAYDIDSDAHVVVAGGAQGVIRVIDVAAENVINTLVGHGDAVNDVQVCPNDSMIIASASKDFTARIWNIRNSACLAILGGVDGHLDQVISVVRFNFLDFDASCEFLASSSMDHTIKLWHIGPGSGVDRMIEQSNCDLKLVDNPAEIHYPRCSTRDIHTNYVDCVRIFHQLIFSKSTEDEIILWKFGDLHDKLYGQGNKVKTENGVFQFCRLILPNSNMWFIKFEIDPKGRFIACGTQNGDIHVWDLKNGSLPSEHSTVVIRPKDVWCTIRQLAVSPNGEHLIAVADDGSISRFSC